MHGVGTHLFEDEKKTRQTSSLSGRVDPSVETQVLKLSMTTRLPPPPTDWKKITTTFFPSFRRHRNGGNGS